jgi:hypothetical protein
MGGLRLFSAVVIAMLLVSTTGTALSAETILLEAENFLAFHQMETRIYRVACGAASGGLAVEGFDEAGEWIEIPMQLAGPIDCLSGVQSAGMAGIIRDYALEIIPTAGQGTSPKDTLATPPGTGIG